MAQSSQSTISVPSSFVIRLDAAARILRGLAEDFKAYKAGTTRHKPKNVPKDQEWFWTDEWQRGEREVDEELARGEFKEFDTVEELIADLDSHI
jgi:hypothetical protein